jgi:hypothetical protein
VRRATSTCSPKRGHKARSARIDDALRRIGFTQIGPDLDGYAHRYERAGLVVDVLGPEGIKPPAKIGSLKAVAAPGGTQALARSEAVTVQVDGRSFELRRPTLLGAILIKARSLMVHHDPEAQREDLLRLLSLVEDPRELARELRTTERRWLRDASRRLNVEGFSNLDGDARRRAALAYELLLTSA